jgi:DNA-binding LytR/AlgR family response regulator
MISCIIVDDDQVALNLVKHFVTNTDGLNLLQAFTDSVEAANFIRKNHAIIDLIFLDVEMPNLTGIEMLASVKDFPPVILISSKDAIQAFDHRVLHYLLKPLEYSKFLKAIERVFVERMAETNQLDYLFVKENGLLTKVGYKDILYFEALGDYVKVHTKDKAHVVNSTMKSIEDKLRMNQHFIRVHRSYHINLTYLQSFDSEIAIISNKTIPIGSKYRSELQNRLMVI